MTEQQRDLHMKKLFKDTSAHSEKDKLITKKLSVSIEESRLQNCPSYLLSSIWDKANVILSVHKVIALGKDAYCVTEYGHSYNVMLQNNKFDCKCKDFSSTSGLCAHSLVVADEQGILNNYLENYRRKEMKGSKAVYSKINKRAGNLPREKKPRRGRQQAKSTPITELSGPPDPELDYKKPFVATSIWHNHELFFVTTVINSPEAKKCQKCLIEFPKAGDFIQTPFDLCIRHLQMYQYPVYDRSVKPPKFIRMEESKCDKKEKFYCPRKQCILGHHPYFWKGLLRKADGFELKEGHKKVLKQNLHYEI